MRKIVLLLVLINTLLGVTLSAQTSERLFYNEPATKWTEALPVGNGRLGAMVYGGVTNEHIQFNEETLWTGEPHDYTHKGANKYLAEIRLLVAAGKQKEAQALAKKEFMSLPRHQKAYQPFGDLYIEFPDHKNYTDYQRELNLENAISKVTYKVGNTNYEREVFSSYPDQIIVINLTADQSKALNFGLYLDAAHEQKSVETGKGQQSIEVKVKDGALRGVATFKLSTNGKISSKEGKVFVAGASKATIYLSASTNFKRYNDVSGDPQKITADILAKVGYKKYKSLKADHLSDYQSLYNRFNIAFGEKGKSAIPTNKRIFKFWKEGNDPELVALYVQYARYLMIASSRPGSLPANLQGIWNDRLDPPWDSKWTTNINAEMNYWPVELTNLSECHEPFLSFIEECTETGSVVAKEHYDCEGWVLHHNTDLWRGAAPISSSDHGIWVSGGAWLTTHFWEHYLFTQDKAFLAEKYWVMKDAALFFSQFLTVDPKTGYLISTPSNSPEMRSLEAGPTMDHQIIRALFRNCIEASEILDTDKEFAHQLKTMIPKIAPNQIGKYGQLQEFMEDKDDPNNHHRHVSHLWGVYPGKEINHEETPELLAAAKRSLQFRGDEGTGWSLAWKINFWSRFLDGNHAYSLIHDLLSPAEQPERKIRGGSYPNLFDAHPPFQIDGNFGGAAGILETVMQSHLDKIDLLPALPLALSEGNISGLCARGGFEISMSWKDSQLVKVEVLSKAGGKCIMKYNDKVVEFDTEKGNRYKFDGMLTQL